MRQSIDIATKGVDAPEVRLIERVVTAHGRRGRAQEKPHLTPLERQLLELQDRSRGELCVDEVRIESDRRQ